MDKYKELILLISEKVSNEKDKKYIIEHIDQLLGQFKKLSYIIDKLFHIITDNSTPYAQKIKQIQHLTQFNNKQTKEILNKIKGSNTSSTFTLPTQSLGLFDNVDFQDFKKPLDLVYIYLFITASIPFVGAISDFLIITQSLEDSNIFLAAIVFITRFISFFTLNIVDLGVVFKLLYYLDNYSYTNFNNIDSK